MIDSDASGSLLSSILISQTLCSFLQHRRDLFACQSLEFRHDVSSGNKRLRADGWAWGWLRWGLGHHRPDPLLALHWLHGRPSPHIRILWLHWLHVSIKSPLTLESHWHLLLLHRTANRWRRRFLQQAKKEKNKDRTARVFWACRHSKIYHLFVNSVLTSKFSTCCRFCSHFLCAGHMADSACLNRLRQSIPVSRNVNTALINPQAA